MAYDRQAVIRAGTQAAKRLRDRLRADLRRDVWPVCASCGVEALPSAVEIDHIVPLSKGGEDVDDNVQVLCGRCHYLKTLADMDYSTPPF